MMFMKALNVLALVAVAQGFAVRQPSAALRPDSAAAVEEALRITASFGITSKEARVAWDIVEEMDASDNRYVAI